MSKARTGSLRTRNAVIFLACVAAWLALDQAAKSYFASPAHPGGSVAVIPGVIDFSLVRNTGAAWGIFSGSTVILGVLSIVVCALIAVYLFALAPRTSILGTIGLALVFAGGVGNAIDRFVNGFVIDFIKTTFIDFPVFNVADIGVSCGVVLFLISLMLEWLHGSGNSPKKTSADAQEGAHGGKEHRH